MAVLEVAMIEVTDPTGFVAAYRSVRPVLAETDGCNSVRMTSGIESPNRFVLMVEWDSVEAHEVNSGRPIGSPSGGPRSVRNSPTHPWSSTSTT